MWNGLLFLLLTALLGITIECIFAIARVGEDTVVKPDSLLGYAHLENQRLTYRQEGFSESKTNSLGFREREFHLQKTPGITRICVLGDSMTVGMEVQPDQTFSRLLENRLNKQCSSKYEVLNCGMSGYGTGQEYLLFRQRVEQLKPDLVVLAYNLGDIDDNVFPRAGMNPPRPLFRVEDSKLHTDLSQVSNWFASNDARFYSSFEWLRKESRILAVLNKLNLDLSNADPLYRKFTGLVGSPLSFVWNGILCVLPPPPQAKIDPAFLHVDLGVAFPEGNKKEHFLSMAPSNPGAAEIRGIITSTEAKAQVSLGIITALNNACRKINSKLVVVSGPALVNSMFYYRELNILQEKLKEQGVVFIEANKHFPPRLPMQESPHFFGLHFTRSGHILMTDAIFNGLKNAGLVQLRN